MFYSNFNIQNIIIKNEPSQSNQQQRHHQRERERERERDFNLKRASSSSSDLMETETTTTETNTATTSSNQLLLLQQLPNLTSDSKCEYHGDSLTFRLGLSHDNHVLFEPSDFSLVRGTITGLVGVNGSGKTSLSRVIAAGSSIIPNFPTTSQLSIQYISSHEEINHYNDTNDDDNDNETNIDELTPEEYLNLAVQEKVDKIQKEIDQLEESMENNDDEESNNIEETANVLSDLYDEQDELTGSSSKLIQQMLNELGFGPHLSKPISQLSSGWKYKCRLAKSFLTKPDILIIDEPSFLDIKSTQWLIQQIRNLTNTTNNSNNKSSSSNKSTMVLFISHKEVLLEELCTRILFINSTSHTLTQYTNTTYQHFRDVLSLQQTQAQTAILESQTNVKHAHESLKKIKSQLHKREKNFKTKTTHDADKRFIKGKNKEAKQNADKSSASKLKQLKTQAANIEEEMKLQSKIDYVKPLHIQGIEGNGTIALLQDVQFGYDPDETLLFDGLDARLESNDRILLRGPNGCGKSTFIKLLLGELQPLGGTINLKSHVLYFPQTSLQELTIKHGHISALSYLCSGDDGGGGESIMTETQARQHLGNFGLNRNLALRQIVTLSAGQKVRLWLSKQLLNNDNKPSLLIMDEITENLDIETRKSLTQILNGFIGATIVVSHDIDFCSTYQPTQIWNLGESSLGLLRIEYP